MWEIIKNIWKSDNLLKEAWSQSFEMLDICQEMYLEATRVLRKTMDTKVDDKIRQKDKTVNKYERDVRRKVMTHLSIRAPQGLPEGMVLISIVIDLERLGDYTKNIVDLALQYKDILKGGKFEADLKKIEAAVKDNFIQTKNCIEVSDQKNAVELLKKFKWVNPLCDDSINKLIKEEDKNLSPGQSVALVLYIRWLKRINSHLRNITTSVVNPFHRLGFKPRKKDLTVT
jgi:phosphate transport system protein